MASSARIDEIKKKFDENPRRYFAPLANEFRKAGDLDQAIVICEEFLPQQAGHMSGHIVYGQALYEAGRLVESGTVFETALSLDPENLIALRHLGDITRAQGDLDDARRWYDRVLEADPRNEEIQEILAAMGATETSAPAAAAPAAFAEAAQGEVHEPSIAVDLDMTEPTEAQPYERSYAAMEIESTSHEDLLFDAISLDGLESTAPEQAPSAAHGEQQATMAEGLEFSSFESTTDAPERQEGLEPMEFDAPTETTERAEGLQSVEFEAPAPYEAADTLLDLESSFAMETGGAPTLEPAEADDAGTAQTSGVTPFAEGLLVPPHAQLDDTSEFTMIEMVAPDTESSGDRGEHSHMDPSAAMEAMPELELEPMLDDQPSTEASSLAEEELSSPMMELPASVIAAESTLMDAGIAYDELREFSDDAHDAEDDAAAPAGSPPPFVTETMADLYLKQGFPEQALDVYRQLASSALDDARLRSRIADLEGESVTAPAAEAQPSVTGPTVREFLFRLASRQPGADSGSATAATAAASVVESVPLPELESEPLSPAAAAESIPTPNQRATTAQGGSAARGTIDALFGERPANSSTDSAASALAQAFGGASETPAITGRPAHAASQELSLDSVFRDGPSRPPRVSQSFSFDQFFADGAATDTGTSAAAAASENEPAERTADDIEQFNSWLQGLKQR